MNFPTTPPALAAHLGHGDGGKRVRKVLRELSPESAPGKGGRWEIDAALADAVGRYFGSARA